VKSVVKRQHKKQGPRFSFLGKSRGAFGAENLPSFAMIPRGGGFRLRKGPVTARPAYLRGVRNAYALKVRDAVMAPAFEAGWLVYVDPDALPRAGDNVVAHLEDGTVVVRRLVRRTKAGVTLRQFNPPKTVRVGAGALAGLHCVVGVRYRL